MSWAIESLKILNVRYQMDWRAVTEVWDCNTRIKFRMRERNERDRGRKRQGWRQEVSWIHLFSKLYSGILHFVQYSKYLWFENVPVVKPGDPIQTNKCFEHCRERWLIKVSRTCHWILQVEVILWRCEYSSSSRKTISILPASIPASCVASNSKSLLCENNQPSFK